MSINLLEILAVALITTFSFYATRGVVPKQTIKIPPNHTVGAIITDLSKQGYTVSIIDKFLLSAMVRLKGVRAGEVNLAKKPIDKLDFLYRLTTATSPSDKVTLIPGETLYNFFEQLATQFSLSAVTLQSEYEKHSHYPEAGIMAETHFIAKPTNESKIIRFLIEESEKTYEALAVEHLGEYNQTKWQEVLTVASIIQKEAISHDEMPLVASVIYNRLKKGMKLQMDGTLNYGKHSHKKITPERLRTDKSHFNTYKHKGLPPSPIGAVSFEAIDAAINPAITEYLFFMRDVSKKFHNFASTYKEHKANISKVKLAQ